MHAAEESDRKLQMGLLVVAWAKRQLDDRTLRALIKEYNRAKGRRTHPSDAFKVLAEQLMDRIENCGVKRETFPAIDMPDRVDVLTDALWGHVMPAATAWPDMSFSTRMSEYLLNFPDFDPRKTQVFALAEASA